MPSSPTINPAPLDPKVDAYLDAAKPFAIPILTHLRALIHKAVPGIEESVKWSRPFFSYKGAILCNISAFTHHCSLGFWGEEIAAHLRAANALQSGAMGSLGRITSLADLPSDNLLLAWLKQAAAFIDSGAYTSPVAARHRVAKAPRPAPETPEDFLAALAKDKPATAVFEASSPSCKREYLDWITSAKRPETRDKRIATALAQLAQGKQLHWKYERP